MRFGQPRAPARLISLTPLIDVVFILLVFFMLASSYLDWRSVDLTVSSGVGVAASDQRALLVGLHADASVSVGSEAVAKQAVRSVMTAKLAGNADRRVVIRSDPGVPLQDAVEMLDLLRSIGAANVSLSRNR